MAILIYLILVGEQFAQDLDVLRGLSAARQGCCLMVLGWLLLLGSDSWFGGGQESLLLQLGGYTLGVHVLTKAELLKQLQLVRVKVQGLRLLSWSWLLRKRLLLLRLLGLLLLLGLFEDAQKILETRLVLRLHLNLA